MKKARFGRSEWRDFAGEVQRAEQRIRPYIRETVLERSLHLSDIGSADVYCKLENLQYTGSFKLRGAMNKLLSLSDEDLSRGVVTASTGNHGMAVAYAARQLNARGTVFTTEGASASKVRGIEQLGAQVHHYGRDCVQTEVFARDYAARNAMTYISPYNDRLVVGGQGTIGIELLRQMDHLDAVFVAVGGGGLISGIAGFLKWAVPGVAVIGASPENSQVMAQSVLAGTILSMPSLPTLSDGTAGGIEPGAITFDLCRELVDEFVTVSETEIEGSLRLFLEMHHMLIEGAAAVAVASYLKTSHRWAGRDVVIVICGGNISLEMLSRIICQQRDQAGKESIQ
jgi:threonine dehydratase